MSEAPFVEMLILCGTAAGLVLLGIVQATLGGRSVPVRVAGTAGCALAAGGLPAAVDQPGAAVLPVAVVMGAGLVLLVASAPCVVSALHRLRSRSIHGALLAAA